LNILALFVYNSLKKIKREPMQNPFESGHI